MKKVLLSLALLASFAYAKDYKVQMLDVDGSGNKMVFEPAYVHIEPGDSVTFVPTNKSHWAKSVVIPDGATKFEGKPSQEATFTFDKEGVYLYVCPPHQMLGMSGIIQVGKASNMDKVTESLPKLEKRVVSNKGRWEEYAKQIQQ